MVLDASRNVFSCFLNPAWHRDAVSEPLWPGEFQSTCGLVRRRGGMLLGHMSDIR